MPKLVTFTRQNGETEYTEFSYFLREDLTDEDYINEVYFGYDDLSEMEGRKDTLNTKDAYWFYDELISIYSIQDISEEELEVLKKFYVV